MCPRRLRPLTLASLCAAACGWTATAFASEPAGNPQASPEPGRRVEVLLFDGRSIAGTLDASTTRDTLWLRSTEPGIVLTSGFSRERIASVSIDGSSLNSHEFFAAPNEAATALPPEFWASFWAFPTTFPLAPVAAGCCGFPAPAAVGPLQSEIAPPVASLRIEARAANWDADPETDGLLVEVLPLDAWGRLRPVNGQLVLTLFGRTVADDVGPRQPTVNAFPVLARSAIAVRQEDYAAGPAVYKLPYRWAHPEARFDAAWYGLVNAKLSAPGAGVFSASDDTVTLRPSSWIRDEALTTQGSRYLPGEASRLPTHRDRVTARHH